jgi:DNA-binding transcriptional MerR regulator
MKINEVEQLLDITKPNIRFYEKKGLLSPARNQNGYREYSEEDIEILKKIILFRKMGISI